MVTDFFWPREGNLKVERAGRDFSIGGNSCAGRSPDLWERLINEETALQPFSLPTFLASPGHVARQE
jgi:hypothetical protein